MNLIARFVNVMTNEVATWDLPLTAETCQATLDGYLMEAMTDPDVISYSYEAGVLMVKAAETIATLTCM